MPFVFNNKTTKKRRQTLRKNMPQPEVVLWAQLRGKQLKGFKFRRQYSVGPYVLDFYCPAARLAIELDGDSHFTSHAETYDRKRAAIIAAYNIRLVRFTNKEVAESIEGVVEVIEKSLELS